MSVVLSYGSTATACLLGNGSAGRQLPDATRKRRAHAIRHVWHGPIAAISHGVGRVFGADEHRVDAVHRGDLRRAGDRLRHLDHDDQRDTGLAALRVRVATEGAAPAHRRVSDLVHQPAGLRGILHHRHLHGTGAHVGHARNVGGEAARHGDNVDGSRRAQHVLGVTKVRAAVLVVDDHEIEAGMAAHLHDGRAG
jgi:hypothetical protein